MNTEDTIYRASHRNQCTNWTFEGTLGEIAECLCANGKAEIITITQAMIDSPDESWDVDEPGLYYTPNIEAWSYEKAGDIVSQEPNALGRTPMEEAVYGILCHDMQHCSLEKIEA